MQVHGLIARDKVVGFSILHIKVGWNADKKNTGYKITKDCGDHVELNNKGNGRKKKIPSQLRRT